MLIWAHGLGPNINPVKELYESLLALGNKKAAGKYCLFCSPWTGFGIKKKKKKIVNQYCAITNHSIFAIDI